LTVISSQSESEKNYLPCSRQFEKNSCLRQFIASFLLILTRKLTILGVLLLQKQIDASFLSVCALIDDKLHHNIVKVCGRNYSPAAREFLSQFDNAMTQFITDKSTDA